MYDWDIHNDKSGSMGPLIMVSFSELDIYFIEIGISNWNFTLQSMQTTGILIQKDWRKTMSLQESGKMYLNAIFLLKKDSAHLRSIDIANYTGYTKPSVSRAVKLLKDKEYIKINNDGYIDFTQKGEELASSLYEKHLLLSEFFVSLGVSKECAREDATKIEHYISDETLQAIKSHMAQR